MLQKEERQKFEIPPVVLLCYTHVIPIREDRMLATAGPKMVLLDKDGTEIFQYKIIRLAEYSFEDDIPLNIINSIKSEDGWSEFVKKLNNDELYDHETAYVENLLIIQDGNKFGVADYDGNILIDAKCFKLQFKRDTDGSIILSHLP